ncbi:MULTISPECIES: PadR family transcriptional regulator [Sphingomonas]|uniref:PadR family transcriptional regulator n=1 Tax=Sphingomonas TaxID=13687 RepID=UPI0023DCF41E|nr:MULTISPECIES: PadR family transcriptional regulator [Sphingomonas]
MMGRGGGWGGFGPDGPFGPAGPFGPSGPFGRDGPYGGGGGGGGGRRGRFFGAGELRLVLLKLIADEPRHGYDLIKALEELTHGVYAPSPGVLYPTLSLLSDEGAIEEQDGGGSRKKFAITDDGRKELADNEEEVAALMERLEATGSSRRESQRPEIGRAMGNLMHALKNRVQRDGWTDELLADVTDILDDAAKRIERLK